MIGKKSSHACVIDSQKIIPTWVQNGGGGDEHYYGANRSSWSPSLSQRLAFLGALREASQFKKNITRSITLLKYFDGECGGDAVAE